MVKYVALLRGIGPANPNMHGSKLKGVVEELGFSNVASFISSGNVLFESGSKDIAKLEATMQVAWPKMLNFNSTTIVRSQKQLQALLARDPYNGVEHSRSTYQLVTFFKEPVKTELKFPYTPDDRSYTLLGIYAGCLCSTLDTTSTKTPNLMVWLEKQFGKDITSRTYKTVQRILQKME